MVMNEMGVRGLREYLTGVQRWSLGMVRRSGNQTRKSGQIIQPETHQPPPTLGFLQPLKTPVKLAITPVLARSAANPSHPQALEQAQT
jgi:hypothetical protein